jgi:hypothetical protein
MPVDAVPEPVLLTRDEARRHVQLEFGGPELTKDECRDVRPLRWLDDLVRDVPLGFRGLARDRLFAMSVTAILSVGVATSVTMFSAFGGYVGVAADWGYPHSCVVTAG